MLAVLLIGVFSIFAAAFLLFATAFTEILDTSSPLSYFAAAAASTHRAHRVLLITNPRHEKEKMTTSERLGEK